MVGTDPEPALPLDAEMHRHAGACWALDVSQVRTLIVSVAGGAGPPNWVEALVVGMHVVDVNQQAVHLVGPYAGRDRVIGQPVTAFWPPESRSILAELVVAVLADFPRHAVRARKVGSLAFSDPVRTVWTAEGGAHPDIVFLAINGTVVDDRSLWALRASEDRYRNLIHHLPIALLQVDARAIGVIFDRLRAEGVTDIDAHLRDHPELIVTASEIVRVTDANQSAMLMFGGGGLADFTGPIGYLFAASPDTARRVMLAHFDDRRSHAEIMKLQTFDGRLLDVQLSVTYPTPPERLDVTLISLDDVTDRLRIETQLRQLQADYTRAARISTLGELATSITHEVNQPLSAIVTNAETSLRWLSRDDPNLAKVGQLTTRIAESARHASEIVQRIRGMAARHTPERVPLDLNEIVDEALLFVGHDIESRSINLSVAHASNLPRVLADRVQLQQVVVNLLVNSIQAITHGEGSKGRIELSTHTDADGAVSITIHDNGPGIAEADLDRIFEGFFTTKEEDIGIGLAICQSIIVAHGGRIAVSNHPQGGAHFRCSLPGGQAAVQTVSRPHPMGCRTSS